MTATDTALFERLYDQHRPMVWRYIAKRVTNRHTVEDIVQEVFMKVWRVIGTIREDHPGGVQPWLVAIARNAITDHHRRAACRPVALTSEGAMFAELRPSSAAGPEEHVVAADEWSADLASLHVTQRPVMRLRCELEFTEAEMAAALDIPAGTVKSRLFYGRRTVLARRAAS